MVIINSMNDQYDAILNKVYKQPNPKIIKVLLQARLVKLSY